MITVTAIGVFGLGFGIAVYAMIATVAPNLARIAAALAGRPQAGFAPLEHLVRAERRIAVRRWSASSRSPSPVRAAA